MPVAAERLERAASAGDAVCDWRAPPEHRDERASDEHDEGHDRRVPASSALCALPRFLDQRLDEGLELLMRDGIAWSRQGRRGGEGHDNLRGD